MAGKNVIVLAVGLLERSDNGPVNECNMESLTINKSAAFKQN